MYQLAKDFLVPLIAPAVAIIVPTVVFFILPRRRDRQKAALDLFAAFTAEEMRKARLEAWAYFVTQVNGDPQEQQRRFDQYLAYLTEDQAITTVAPNLMEMYQKASRVLDFFVLVEGCIEQGLVNEGLVKCYLAHFYLWWRENLMVPIRKRRLIESCDPRRMPLWWRPLEHLDRSLCVPA